MRLMNTVSWKISVGISKMIEYPTLYMPQFRAEVHLGDSKTRLSDIESNVSGMHFGRRRLGILPSDGARVMSLNMKNN
jgi:hypothetical protein